LSREETDMSQSPPPPPFGSTPVSPYPAPQAGGASNGLGIAALILAVVGLCVPFLGLVGLVLGIVAISKARNEGRGLAIAAIAVGAVSFLMSFLMLGLLLPALGKARQTAREIQSSSSMSMITRSMIADQFDGLTDGAPDYNLEAQLQIPPDMWGADLEIPRGVGTAYLLIAPGDPKLFQSLDSSLAILVENPKAFDRDRLSVSYADGFTERVPRAEAIALLEKAAGRVYNSDGTPWKP